MKHSHTPGKPPLLFHSANAANPEQLFSRKALAARWQCSVETIKRRTAAGQLHAIRFGPRMVRYALDEIRRVERDAAGGKQ